MGPHREVKDPRDKPAQIFYAALSLRRSSRLLLWFLM